jgi:hypothetical protein
MGKFSLGLVLITGCWVGGNTGAGGADGSAGDGNVVLRPTQCTSGVTVATEDLQNKSLMHPGQACNACHDTQTPKRPHYDIAGTVYANDNEQDDCSATAAVDGVTVVITDKNKKVFTIALQKGAEANATPAGKTAYGNFAADGLGIVPPYTAKLVSADKTRTRPMVAEQTSGDCNSCHTEQGANAAPGRILAP